MVRHASLALLVLVGTSLSAHSAPKIQVSVGNTPILGASGTNGASAQVDFGTAQVANALSKTFTLKNLGATNLQLIEPIQVPPGFTLKRSFAVRGLAPGQSTHFVVALNSARAGRLSGRLALRATDGQATEYAISLTGVALGPPSMRIIDDGNPGFRTVGPWTAQTGRGYQNTVHTIAAGTGANVATWTFGGLEPGRYLVAVTWPAGSALATDARFVVHNGTQAFAPVVVNQQVPPSDLHDAGVFWRPLGAPYMITADTLVVKLSDLASSQVAADAVRIHRAGLPAGIIDNGQRGFSSEGRWLQEIGSGFGGTAQAAAPGSLAKARWAFRDLVPGKYRVSATWPASTRAATNAAFTVLDGANELARVAANQQVAPSDLTDAGASWSDLGGQGMLHTVTGHTLTVVLSAQPADGPVIADAIRIERIYNPPGDIGPAISTADTVRFLEQATWGPNQTNIDYVINNGLQTFLQNQVTAPISSYPSLPLVSGSSSVGCPNGSPPTCNRDNYTMYPLQIAFFSNGLYAPDQTRQRFSWAMHKIMVASGVTETRPSQMCYYLQIFSRNSDRNYRQMLYDITLNPAMGDYLNMRGSTATAPNENYAREIMQLFSIGLNVLNPDGTPVLDSDGNPIPTYTQDTVNAFARAFTGWNLASQPMPGIDNYIAPMVATASRHDTHAKTLLNGVTLPAGQTALQDLNGALDNIATHANVGPFLCKGLIQQLVTSNPSPDYVARVAAQFNDNGHGVQGSFLAVMEAILLDPEARGDVKTDPGYGKLREPAQFVLNVCRAFNALSYDLTTQSDGYLNPQITPMNQDALRPPTVFSYFSPLFQIPGSNLYGPEYQIFTAATSLKHANFLNTMVNPNGAATSYGIAVSNPNAPNGTKLDLSYLQSIAGDTGQLVDYLNTLLLHGTMSDQMRTSVINAVDAESTTDTLKRSKVAVYLVATSSQYQVQQ
jgi:uncharacterized protein (DUF1800 family)